MSQFIASHKERWTSIHLSKIKQGLNESLAMFVRRFHQKVALIVDVEDWVVYTSFLNSLKSGQFKFSPAKQKETSLAEALKKVIDFVRATKIYVEGGDGNRKSEAKERNQDRVKRRQRSGGQDQYFK